MTYKALPPPVRVVCRPLLVVSVLLHGLLLAVPWSRTPQMEITLEATSEQGEAIATVRLEDLLAPTADSLPEPVSPAPVAQENPTAAAIAPPAPLQPASPQSTPAEVAVAPAPAPAFMPPPVPPAPEIESASALQTVLSGLQGTAAVEVTPDLFEQPDAFFDGLATDPWRYKPDILRTAVVEETSPSQVFITLLANSRESGFRSTQQADYGGGLVYEVVRQDQRWFFNLVPTTQGGTAIVVWAQVPS
jgi:hypothetical protein